VSEEDVESRIRRKMKMPRSAEEAQRFRDLDLLERQRNTTVNQFTTEDEIRKRMHMRFREIEGRY